MTGCIVRAVLMCAAGAVLAGLCALPAQGGAGDKRLDIYWIDVEGGGATLIVTPAGESILIDAGMDGGRDPDRIAAVARQAAKIQQIDHLVVTHFDIDHHGGAAEVAKRIPVRKVYDPGGQRGSPDPSYDKYLAFRQTAAYTVLKAGDTIPLRQADGAAKVSLTCLAAAKKFAPPGPAQKPNPIPASESPAYAEDTSENANSTVLLLRFGDFEFLDTADLTGRLEASLVCPVNLAGEVDVFQVGHHGLDLSNNPVLVRSVKPTVTVMNNGHRKGCGPKTRAALKATDSIQANYQLHKNLGPGADNTDEELIANLGPADGCKANHIELHAAPDAASYAVRIPARDHQRAFKTK
ncbi:MAG: MBL fold metallo-hydrolase [Planctomycetes bacterium]|nr:MBL fold metallo-hydrolase [Planctomycetota bacterium]